MYFDYSTTNKSFLDMHLYLKSINIKNNNFMLSINNKELIDIDPYDPNISDDIKLKIIDECKKNIYYFLREVVRIPKQGGGVDRYELNRANCSQLFLFMNDRINWLSAPRLLRKTISTECIILWTDLFFDNNKTKVLSYNEKQSKYEVQRINTLRSCLPYYLKSFSNKNTIDFSCIPSTIDEAVCYGNKEFINYNIIYYNEAEYIPFVKTIFDSSLKSFLKSKMKNFAENKIRKFGILFESVYSDNAEENGALDIINSCIKWDETFYDTIEKVDISKMIYIKYYYFELGKDENWYKHCCALLNNDPKMINKEILLRRNHEDV